MAYTTVTLVRQHFTLPNPILKSVTDQPVIFDTDEDIMFFNGTVDEDSVRVKTQQSKRNHTAIVTVSGGEAVFSVAPVVTGSVIVSSDSSFSTLYTDHVDYIINFAEGKLISKSDQIIPDGTVLFLSYMPFDLYVLGQDYLLDAKNGSLKKMSSGRILAKEQILLDYKPVSVSFDEDLLAYAVDEANGLIANTIDPNRQFGADTMLQTAATYLALAIVCRSSAARELAGGFRDDRVAKSWLDIAADYTVQSEELLATFKEPLTPPASPTRG